MLTIKINFAMANWIRDSSECLDKNPTVHKCIKFVQWKLEYYKFFDSYKRIIGSVLLYESE